MKEFEVKKESVKRRRTGLAAAAIVASIGLVSITGLLRAREEVIMAGDIMPAQITRDEAIRQMDEHFKKDLNLAMRHDVRLNIRNGTTNVNFVADGYDADAKVAYEFIPYSYTNANPANTLTEEELKFINGFKVGDTWILTIRESYYNTYDLDYAFYRFISIYTNREEPLNERI
jgi:hypothetical protein